MGDTETKLAELKARVDSARTSRTRAEIERDNAETARQKALDDLKAEFEILTPEEGVKLLKKSEEELQVMIQNLENALDKLA